MRRTLCLSLVLLATCSRPSAAGDATTNAQVQSLRDSVLATSQAYETVRSLSDEAGPRLSGSPGAKVAVSWAVRALGNAGLTRVHEEPVMVPHWERGEESGALVEPSAQPLVLAALGGSVATPPGGIEAEVIEFPSVDALDKADPALVRGKIVFFHMKMDRTADGSGYGRAVTPRAIGAIHAAKLGAAAVVIRSVGTDDNRAPHTGGLRYDNDVPKIPAAALAIPDADVIHRLLAAGQRVKMRLTLGARTLPDAEGANVVGDVVGSSAPNEIVLLGAHLDSWDLGRGALDDGAGCAIVIEAARQIANLPRHPRRTIRVVLFANEENGLRGAVAYGKAHAAELSSHVLAMEADLGDGRVKDARFLGAPSALPLFRSLAAHLEPLGVTASSEAAHGGSDLIPLVSAGVPILDLRQDASLYFDFHHTANDTMERVRKPDLDQAAAAYAAAAYAAADTPSDFGRIPRRRASATDVLCLARLPGA
ncbi:Aminopeptidase [Minicystis rosea]|nr:Aminopeptidase [Minicystis rosea]